MHDGPALTPALRALIGGVRLATALLCAIALVARFEWGLGSVTFNPGNFFAYLTIQSNIAFVVVTAIAGAAALRGHLHTPRLDYFRAGVLTCTVTAGLVFGLIVQQSAARSIRVDVPWSDVVLHFILPVVAIIDWYCTPRAKRMPRRIIVFVVGYVFTWAGITMARGSLVDWYPYYFLDPRQVSGIGEFVTVSLIALAVFISMGSLIVRVPPRLLVKKRLLVESG